MVLNSWFSIDIMHSKKHSLYKCTVFSVRISWFVYIFVFTLENVFYFILFKCCIIVILCDVLSSSVEVISSYDDNFLKNFLIILYFIVIFGYLGNKARHRCRETDISTKSGRIRWIVRRGEETTWRGNTTQAGKFCNIKLSLKKVYCIKKNITPIFLNKRNHKLSVCINTRFKKRPE